MYGVQTSVEQQRPDVSRDFTQSLYTNSRTVSATTASFHILSNSSFINRPPTQLYHNLGRLKIVCNELIISLNAECQHKVMQIWDLKNICTQRM